jgi:hypothetical protein
MSVFFVQKLCAQFLVFEVWLNILFGEKNGGKAAHKILVKLTPGGDLKTAEVGRPWTSICFLEEEKCFKFNFDFST